MTTVTPLTTSGKGVPPHVFEVIRAAEQELSVLLQRRCEIMRRIGTVKQMLTGMANVFGDAILDDELRAALNLGVPTRRSGFTRACRMILIEARAPMRARQACDDLLKKYPELAERHKDLAASITTVFNRLVDYGEARSFLDGQGIRLWEWATDRNVSGEENGPAAEEIDPEPSFQA